MIDVTLLVVLLYRRVVATLRSLKFKADLSARQLRQRAQLMSACPIAIADGGRMFGWLLPVASMGKQEVLTADLRLPRLALPVDECKATIGMATPSTRILRNVLECTVANPGRPSFPVPGDELHSILRPRLIGKRAIGIDGRIKCEPGRQYGDQKRCQQAEDYLRH